MTLLSGNRLLSLFCWLLVSSGCSTLLPRESDVTHQPWKSFDETQACFDAIVPHQTAVPELRIMGLDPLTSPNVKVLSYLDLITRFLPHNGIRREDLDQEVQRCLEARDACTAYELVVLVHKAKRTGNVFLDLFGFRRTTHVTGWNFTALLVLKDNIVVYKLRSGEPNIDRTEQRVRPLGPLQELDHLLGDAAASAI